MTTDKYDSPTPTISRVCSDGTLIELLYDGEGTTEFAVCTPDGRVSVERQVEFAAGERLIPYAPDNNLLTSGCVLLPSEIGMLLEKSALVAQIKAFIHRYVDLPELFEEIAAHYVLLTWVHDAFNELGYLRFGARWGQEKRAPCSRSDRFRTSRSSLPVRRLFLRSFMCSTALAGL